MGKFVERDWYFFPQTSGIATGSSIIVGRLHADLDKECDAVVEFRNVYELTEDTQISPETLKKWWSKEPIMITTIGSPKEISIMTPEGIPWRYGYLFEATKIESTA